MPVFAVEYTYDDRASARDALRPAHRAFLRDLLDAGTLLASGPLTTGTGALLVVVADDDAGALRVLDADPFHGADLVRSREVRGWAPVIGPWSTLADA